MTSWMAQLLERGRQRHGDRVAVVDGDRYVTYARLDERTNSLAAAFLSMGVERGTRVAVLSHNRLEVLETYFALGKIGAAAVPIYYSAVPDEIAAIVGRSGSSVIVGEEDLLAKAYRRPVCPTLAYESVEYRDATSGAPCPPCTVPDGELLFILHTSATTGRSKGVCVDHSSLRSVTLGYLTDVGLEQDTVFLHCVSLAHGAMVLPLIYMAAGASVGLMRMFSPAECLTTIGRTQATHVFLVPDMLRFISQAMGPQRGRLASLREIVYGAAPMPRSVLLDARAKFGCGFRQVYGLTEGGGPVATLPPSDHDYAPGEAHGPAASVGRAVMGTTVSVHDDGGVYGEQDPAARKTGELWVCGPAVMREYWDDPAATKEAMRDGWVRTGDLGTIDENGYIYLAGRVKDVIVRGGQKVFPAEVERVLLTHPAVSEACVVGIPSDAWGELPFAYVAAADPTPSLVESLRCLAREHLALYKRPVGFEVVSELPRNSAGKIARRDLRAQAINDIGQLEVVSS